MGQRARRLVVMAPAHRRVLLVGPELDLRAAHRRRAVDEPQVTDRLLRTVLAGHLDLLDAIGELHQALRGGKQPGPEVGAQPVADHRNAGVHRDPAQVLDHRWRQELRFVDQHAIEVRELARIEHGVLLDQQVGGRLEPRARRDRRRAEPAVDARLDQQHALALLAIIVRHREQVHRLRRVHRAVPEVELRHGPSLDCRADIRRSPSDAAVACAATRGGLYCAAMAL
jgi:hypothetical protein